MKNIFTLIFVCIVAAGSSAYAGYSLRASVPVNLVTINKPLPVNITVSSSLAAQTYVTNIQLTATSTSNATNTRIPMAVTQWNPFNTSVTIGSGGNQSATIGAGPIIFFSPSSGITGSGTGTYHIGGTVYTSDGAVTPITIGASIRVNPIPLPAYERQ